ncbi:putative ABC transport system ATP-binding protein [Paraoerskovia marina]|uniref:Putative ABC transport system ATP-binding protein n=1 Tax=Paraoerskovia marina TaxID=545619 RepID=A0A1H1PL18_9CELL|nr:ATP-binding cassette domain-containing protein [Paraoerskovia marina]SDS11777.1 putative ABC transport system ATP-binding protein [Paraoerskovia marina]
MLEAHALHLTYPGAERAAVAGVDLVVEPDEVVAVTGPSGCGKSTLLHLLAGVLVPDAGTVHLRGRSLSGSSSDGRALARRRGIGMVFQDGRLVPELPAVEDVMLPLLVDGIRRREARRRAMAALESVGLGELTVRRPTKMSGGQAQRVAIARALVHEPSVVLADEPTGALDRATGTAVMDLLVSSVRARGGALVVVTHDEQVAAAADRRVAMLDGVVSPAGAQGSASGAPRAASVR